MPDNCIKEITAPSFNNLQWYSYISLCTKSTNFAFADVVQVCLLHDKNGKPEVANVDWLTGYHVSQCLVAHNLSAPPRRMCLVSSPPSCSPIQKEGQRGLPIVEQMTTPRSMNRSGSVSLSVNTTSLPTVWHSLLHHTAQQRRGGGGHELLLRTQHHVWLTHLLRIVTIIIFERPARDTRRLPLMPKPIRSSMPSDGEATP